MIDLLIDINTDLIVLNRHLVGRQLLLIFALLLQDVQSAPGMVAVPYLQDIEKSLKP